MKVYKRYGWAIKVSKDPVFAVLDGEEVWLMYPPALREPIDTAVFDLVGGDSPLVGFPRVFRYGRVKGSAFTAVTTEGVGGGMFYALFTRQHEARREFNENIRQYTDNPRWKRER